MPLAVYAEGTERGSKEDGRVASKSSTEVGCCGGGTRKHPKDVWGKTAAKHTFLVRATAAYVDTTFKVKCSCIDAQTSSVEWICVVIFGHVKEGSLRLCRGRAGDGVEPTACCTSVSGATCLLPAPPPASPPTSGCRSMLSASSSLPPSLCAAHHRATGCKRGARTASAAACALAAAATTGRGSLQPVPALHNKEPHAARHFQTCGPTLPRCLPLTAAACVPTKPSSTAVPPPKPQQGCCCCWHSRLLRQQCASVRIPIHAVSLVARPPRHQPAPALGTAGVPLPMQALRQTARSPQAAPRPRPRRPAARPGRPAGTRPARRLGRAPLAPRMPGVQAPRRAQAGLWPSGLALCCRPP
jgi:hypothetical protein